jgi:hypothetical protein
VSVRLDGGDLRVQVEAAAAAAPDEPAHPAPDEDASARISL